MRLIWIGLFGILITVFMGACSGTEPGMPEDFALIFTWDTGSLPPLYRYEYVITIGPGPQGEFEYVPGYGDEKDPDFWVTSFDISEEKLHSLFDYLNKEGVFNKKWNTDGSRVGGSNTSLIITAFGKDNRVPSISSLEGDYLRLAETTHDHIRTYVPQSIWDEMEKRQSAYKESEIN